MKKILSLATTLALTAACSDGGKFKGSVAEQQAAKGPEPKTEDQTPEPPVKEKVVKTIELKTTSTAVPVDMVWVVDNSGSMKEEVAQVRSNIQAFVSSVGAKADLRLSILSTDQGQFGLQFDSMITKDFLQVKSNIGSYNLLTSLAAALCPADQLELKQGGGQGSIAKLCGKEVSNTSGGGYNEDSLVQPFAGTIAARMRPEAQKVFVFVSDDNARSALDSKNFFSVTGVDPTMTHVYAFIGQEKKTGCAIANIGENYKDLAKQTGGETFDICAQDWSENFSKLTENVIKLTSNTFEIPTDINSKNIKSVKVGGTELTSKQYFAGNGALVIIERSLLTETTVVTIDYEVEE